MASYTAQPQRRSSSFEGANDPASAKLFHLTRGESEQIEDPVDCALADERDDQDREQRHRSPCIPTAWNCNAKHASWRQPEWSSA